MFWSVFDDGRHRVLAAKSKWVYLLKNRIFQLYAYRWCSVLGYSSWLLSWVDIVELRHLQLDRLIRILSPRANQHSERQSRHKENLDSRYHILFRQGRNRVWVVWSFRLSKSWLRNPRWQKWEGKRGKGRWSPCMNAFKLNEFDLTRDRAISICFHFYWNDMLE